MSCKALHLIVISEYMYDCTWLVQTLARHDGMLDRICSIVAMIFAHKNHLAKLENPTVLQQHLKMFVSAVCFNRYAMKYFTNKDISWAFDKPSRLSSRKFKSLFLYNVKEVVRLWDNLFQHRDQYSSIQQA
jgi:hypothetical protein